MDVVLSRIARSGLTEAGYIFPERPV
jgi:hypothetical protein